MTLTNVSLDSLKPGERRGDVMKIVAPFGLEGSTEGSPVERVSSNGVRCLKCLKGGEENGHDRYGTVGAIDGTRGRLSSGGVEVQYLRAKDGSLKKKTLMAWKD